MSLFPKCIRRNEERQGLLQKLLSRTHRCILLKEAWHKAALHTHTHTFCVYQSNKLLKMFQTLDQTLHPSPFVWHFMKWQRKEEFWVRRSHLSRLSSDCISGGRDQNARKGNEKRKWGCTNWEMRGGEGNVRIVFSSAASGSFFFMSDWQVWSQVSQLIGDLKDDGSRKKLWVWLNPSVCRSVEALFTLKQVCVCVSMEVNLVQNRWAPVTVDFVVAENSYSVSVNLKSQRKML